MSQLLQDLRYAARVLKKSPGFSLLALSTLALGIGANTAIFSATHGVLLRPLPFPDGDRLAFITRSGDVSLPDGEDWRADSETFEEIALFLRYWAFDLTGEGEPERLQGAVVEPQFFEVLGLEPSRGRLFTEAENQLGGGRVALVSEDFWQRRLGGSPDVVGRTLRLSGNPVTILGVLPPEADFLSLGTDLWVPPAIETPWAVGQRGTNNFDAIGRLRPGVSIEEAQAEMLAISQRLEVEYPGTNAGKIVVPISLLDFLVGRVRPALLVLQAAVGLVLLISSLNLASLLLAKSTARQQELATRLAVGAGRGRIVRQLLTEGLLLATAGGALGTLVAVWGTDLLLAVTPESLPRSAEIAVDGGVLGFALAVSLASGLIFGLLPAFQVFRTDLDDFLKSTGRGSSTSRGRHRVLGTLAAAEIALASLLLIGSGLLIRSFQELRAVDLGFEPEQVLTADVVLPESGYADRERQSAAFQAMVEALTALPGAETAASIIGAPLEPRGGIGHRLVIAGRELAEGEQWPGVRSRPVVGDYFRAVRQPLFEGRAFEPTDDADAPPVAIVNRTLAEELWPGRSPLGERIAWRFGDSEPRWMTIVGVVGDVKSTTVYAPDERAVYSPYLQRDASWQRFGTLVLRTSGGAVSGRAMQEAVWTVDPDLPLENLQTLAQKLSGAIAQERFNTTLLSVFAASALLLALLGVYGVLAYSVAERRRELGVRMALGAERRHLIRGVLRRGLMLTGAGLAGGLIAALALGRLVQSLLFGVHASDGVSFSIAALVLLATAFAACYWPAHRASRLDPVEALRHE